VKKDAIIPRLGVAPAVIEGPTIDALDASSAEMVDAYLRSLQSPKSKTTMAESLQRMTRAAGYGSDARAFPWNRLDYNGMMTLRERLISAGHPPSTCNMSLSALRSMLKIAYVLGKITTDQRFAVDQIKNVRGKRETKGRELSNSEVKKLWKATSDLEPLECLQMRAMLSVFLAGGLRREEVCALPARALRDGDLHVIGKGNRERCVYVDKTMQEHLVEWLDTRKTLEVPHALMFITIGRKNGPLRVWNVWFKIRELAARAGLVDEQGQATIAPHDFRRTFATRLLDAGFDMSEVQKLMGHESIATTVKYDKRALKRLGSKRRELDLFPEMGEAA
jgi:site-specific recombinase XerD